MRLIVNFAPEIREIISEAKYLGLLGYSVPPVALNVALQEYKLIRYYERVLKEFGSVCKCADRCRFRHVSNLIFRHSDDLHRLVSRYHSALDSLNEMKTVMLAEQISAVQKEMDMGCKRLNWNSLGMALTESKIVW